MSKIKLYDRLLIIWTIYFLSVGIIFVILNISLMSLLYFIYILILFIPLLIITIDMILHMIIHYRVKPVVKLLLIISFILFIPTAALIYYFIVYRNINKGIG